MEGPLLQGTFGMRRSPKASFSPWAAPWRRRSAVVRRGRDPPTAPRTGFLAGSPIVSRPRQEAGFTGRAVGGSLPLQGTFGMRRSPKVPFSSMGCAMEEKIGCWRREGPSNGTANRLPGGVSDRVETPPGSRFYGACRWRVLPPPGNFRDEALTESSLLLHGLRHGGEDRHCEEGRDPQRHNRLAGSPIVSRPRQEAGFTGRAVGGSFPLQGTFGMRRSPKVPFSSMGCAMEEKIGCCEEGEGPSNGTPNRLPGGVSDRVETPPGSRFYGACRWRVPPPPGNFRDEALTESSLLLHGLRHGGEDRLL